MKTAPKFVLWIMLLSMFAFTPAVWSVDNDMDNNTPKVDQQNVNHEKDTALRVRVYGGWGDRGWRGGYYGRPYHYYYGPYRPYYYGPHRGYYYYNR